MRCYQRDLYAVLGLGLWLALYLWTGASTFQPADSAEFLTVVAHHGIAHPPGYPLYTMLGILAHQIIPGSVTMALSFLAAFITWGTLLGVYAAIRQLCHNRITAFFAAGVTGTSLHIWKHATHPEAFALLGFFAAWLTVLVILALDPKRSLPQRRLAFFGYALVVGLASTHHHTIILTAPMGLLLLYRLFLSPSTQLPRRGALLLGGVGLFLLGLTPYLYLFTSQTTGIGSWGSIETFPQLWDHFLRKEFGTFTSGLYESKRAFWFHSWIYLKKSASLRWSFPFGLSVLWMIGLFVTLSRRWPHASASTEESPPSDQDIAVLTWRREIVWSWVACWILAGLVFPTQLKMGTLPLDQYVAARFFLLPDLFLGLLSGIAIHYLLERADFLGQRIEEEVATAPRKRFLKPMVIFTASYLIIMGVVNQYWHASSRQKNWLETYARDLLKELPKGALLLEAGDEAVCFGITYLQQVKRLRPDVRFICLPLLGRRWYAQQLRRAWPEFRYRWDAKRISSLALISHYNKLGRPVHATELYNRSIQVFPWIPYGLSWSVWQSKTKPPPAPRVVERMLLKRYYKMASQAPLPHRLKEPWPTRVLRRYANPWFALGGIYRRQRKMKAVRRCRRRARLWIP